MGSVATVRSNYQNNKLELDTWRKSHPQSRLAIHHEIFNFLDISAQRPLSQLGQGLSQGERFEGNIRDTKRRSSCRRRKSGKAAGHPIDRPTRRNLYAEAEPIVLVC